MKKSDAFPSKWLRADDLQTEDGKPIAPVLTIISVRSQEFTQTSGEKKLLRVLRFQETDKELPLNVTNWDTIALVTNQDDDDLWAGRKIKLYRKMVDSPNGRQWGLRIHETPEQPVPQPAPAPATPESPPAEPAADEHVPGSGDDLPF